MHSCPHLIAATRQLESDLVDKAEARVKNSHPCYVGQGPSQLRPKPDTFPGMKLAASAKLDALWGKCKEELWTTWKYPSVAPDPEFTLAENLLDVFDHPAELFPRGYSKRFDKKLIHPYGCTGKVRFEPVMMSPTRGLLAESCEGLIRVSDGSVDQIDGFAPGVALKFPISGYQSGDLVLGPAEFDSGFKDSSITEIDQRTWLGAVKVQTRTRDLRTLVWLFDRYREHDILKKAGQSLHFAGRAVSPQPLLVRTQDGSPTKLRHGQVDPIGLIYKPTRALKKAWKAARGGKSYLHRLPKILGESHELHLYDVEGLWSGRDHGMVTFHTQPLGALFLTAAFLRSKYGDSKLFFRHPPEPPSADLAYKHRQEALLVL